MSSKRKSGVTSLVSTEKEEGRRTSKDGRDTGCLYTGRSAASHGFQGIDEEGFDLEGFPGGGLRGRDESGGGCYGCFRVTHGVSECSSEL